MQQGSKPRPKQKILGAITDRQISGLRFFLSTTALFAIHLDPSEPDRFVPLTYGALVIYTLYSASIYSASRQVETFSRRAATLFVWADVLLYSVLICLSSGTNSIFFLFYFFVIVVACGRLGSNTGIGVTLVATFLAVLLGYLSTPPAQQEWNRFLLRPIGLIVMGYILIYWANAEHSLRRRLDLLRHVSSTANPRFGIDRTAAHFMERVLEFFNADACIFMEYAEETERYQLRCATARDPRAGSQLVPAPDDINKMLQAAPKAGVAVYTEQRTAWKRTPKYTVWHPVTQLVEKRSVKEASAMSEWIGGRSFMFLPLRHHEQFKGYLIVGAAGRGAFRLEDGKFLLQLADQVMPVIEHIRLVDRMASDAAEEERRRIARSVHDRVIQPYIGLQMGLLGVRPLLHSVVQATSEGPACDKARLAMNALDDLVEMAGEGVEELRQYVYGLRTTKGCGDLLIESLLRYAAKFETVTGIRVTVGNRLQSRDINDRLAGEIFQMATEALSNVHRHTTATSASLTIERSLAGNIAVRIENEARKELANPDFMPQSIAERVESLGGQTEVSTADGRTVVQIEIPL